MYKIIISVVIVIIIFTNGCGQIGTIQKYKFLVKKEVLDSAISRFYIKHPEFAPQGKWEENAEEIRQSANFLKFYFLYYPIPEEMIVFQFSGDSISVAFEKGCILSISASSRYSKECKCLRFEKESVLDSDEQIKVIARFETTFLNKLGYKYERINSWE